jgi:hypothetical protein
MGKIATIYTENQALEDGDLPPKVLYTWNPLLGEMGSKQQPFSPMGYFGLTKAAIKYSDKDLSAPSLYVPLIYEGIPKDSNNGVGVILANPSKVTVSLTSLLGKNVLKEGDIKGSMYRKIKFITGTLIPKMIKREPIIDEITHSASGKTRIEISDDELGVAIALLEDWIGEDRVSVATPRGFAMRPIGLGGKQRLVNKAVIEGYKGVFTYLSPEVPVIVGRNQRQWLLASIVQILYMTTKETTKINEIDLIRSAMILEQLLINGVEFTSLDDALQILPWWSRWALRPSITNISHSTNKVETAKFILNLYVLGRLLSLLKASGVDTLIAESRWHFTGKELPGSEYLLACFRGQFNTSISGVKSLWAWPSTSMSLEMGEWQIMGYDQSRRNYWHPKGTVSEMKIRPSTIFIEDKYFVVPNLIDEGYDGMVVSLEPNMRRAKIEEIYHAASRPPMTILISEKIGPDAGDDWRDILATILVGGQPLITGDILIENPHAIMSYAKTLDDDLPDTRYIRKDRVKDYERKVIREKLSAAGSKASGLLYDGDILNKEGTVDDK